MSKIKSAVEGYETLNIGELRRQNKITHTDPVKTDVSTTYFE